MSETHDQDDLPPKKEKPHSASLAVMVGEIVGSLVWIVPILAVGAVLAWLLIRWMS
jgi:hypothetical protein